MTASALLLTLGILLGQPLALAGPVLSSPATAEGHVAEVRFTFDVVGPLGPSRLLVSGDVDRLVVARGAAAGPGGLVAVHVATVSTTAAAPLGPPSGTEAATITFTRVDMKGEAPSTSASKSAPPSPPHLRPAEGTPATFGVLRPLRDLLRVLVEILRAVGALFLLYHRIGPAEALGHPLRARLHARVEERPGAHVAALAADLGAHPKTVMYHLRVLGRGRLVRLVPEGRTLRAFPIAGATLDPPDTSDVRLRALDLIREGGATTRADLAAALGITPQAVSYHLALLQAQGKIRARWRGRARSYEAAGPPPRGPPEPTPDGGRPAGAWSPPG